MKTRSANGKFARLSIDNSQHFDHAPSEKGEITPTLPTTRPNYSLTARTNGAIISFPIPQNGWSFMKVLILVLIFSPWLYLIFRKQNREIMTKKVSDFFDDNFSCPPCEPCLEANKTELFNQTTTNPKKGF